MNSSQLCIPVMVSWITYDFFYKCFCPEFWAQVLCEFLAMAACSASLLIAFSDSSVISIFQEIELQKYYWFTQWAYSRWNLQISLDLDIWNFLLCIVYITQSSTMCSTHTGQKCYGNRKSLCSFLYIYTLLGTFKYIMNRNKTFFFIIISPTCNTYNLLNSIFFSELFLGQWISKQACICLILGKLRKESNRCNPPFKKLLTDHLWWNQLGSQKLLY